MRDAIKISTEPSTFPQSIADDSTEVIKRRNGTTRSSSIVKGGSEKKGGEEVKPKNEKARDFVEVRFAPASPEQCEMKKRKRESERKVVTRAMAAKNGKLENG
ncbi:hypothetical protein PIB30_018812 [Stylosanthes scabra]|uniref:Uncharacterized protein n=1 Tax=Stylosanthes scabra TaxID=79078 RepID=A0ABU6S7X2_9FABA|nr:hypothetical protein [Stylosanthes scabra]